MAKPTKTTPIDDAIESARGVETAADGRKLKDAPNVGAHAPDADPDDPRSGRRIPRPPSVLRKRR